MRIDELANLNTLELLSLYRGGQLSPVEAVRATLDHAARVNGAINALFHIVGEQAMAEAKASEARWRRNEPRGRLDGVPVTVKDSVNVAGWP